MKNTRNFIPCTLVLACLTLPLIALEHDSGIQIRIHAPFADLYVGEVDYWLVRVENRGTQTIPVPDGGPNEKGEGSPPQFQVQTEESARTGKKPMTSAWGEIQSFGNGMEAMVDKSVLEPGQAMEAFSQGLAGQLRTPPQGGMFRIAMQVGPDDFVYSNWIARTRHEATISSMRTIHVAKPWGNTFECQIQISESTSPKYVWFSPVVPASRFAEPSLRRICEVPEGMLPDIQIDMERGQYVIAFPPGGPDTVYYAHRCGLSKSTPWPKGYRSKDFLLRSYPISTPSPIGFPMDLFRGDVRSLSNHETRSPTERHNRHDPRDVLSITKGFYDKNLSIIWFFLIATIFLIGFIFFLIRRKKSMLK